MLQLLWLSILKQTTTTISAAFWLRLMKMKTSVLQLSKHTVTYTYTAMQIFKLLSLWLRRGTGVAKEGRWWGLWATAKTAAEYIAI